jgi:hypothetical protein
MIDSSAKQQQIGAEFRSLKITGKYEHTCLFQHLTLAF